MDIATAAHEATSRWSAAASAPIERPQRKTDTVSAADGELTTRIHAVVDTQGSQFGSAMIAGQKHDGPLADAPFD